jgi:archaellum component FlaC
VNFYLAAASVTLFLILTPLLYLNKIHKSRTLDVTDYIGIIKDNSATVTKMAETLNPLEKEMVLNTLEELTFEAIPFDSQLSEDVKNGERGELLKMYYSPKIEGIEKLKKYVAQLNNDN